MAATNPLSDQSPYCSFKNDRARLWALVSRDIRLVLIAAALAFAAPAISGHASQLWTVFKQIAR